jgi:hypothetical protein
MEEKKTLKFPGQKPHEVVELLIRKHWVIDFIVLGFSFVVLGLPLLLAVLFGELVRNRVDESTFALFLLGFLVYLYYGILLVYLRWLNEELDIVIVTNERVITHEQIKTFHRQTGEAGLQDVQDVKGTEKGLIGHLLHFGVLEITTSSNERFFRVKHVARPYENASVMLDIRDVCLRTLRRPL